MSQLETQHHQVTMLGNNKYTKPVGKFGSFVCLSLWSVEEMRFHGTIQSYEFHCELFDSIQTVWKERNIRNCFHQRPKDISCSNVFAPHHRYHWVTGIVVIAMIVVSPRMVFLPWQHCKHMQKRFHRDRSFYYEVLIYKINDTTTRHQKLLYFE